MRQQVVYPAQALRFVPGFRHFRQLTYENCEDIPDDAEERIKAFIDELIERGYAGHEIQEV